MRRLLVSIVALIPTVALAGGPEITVADDGTIVAKMTVDAPEATIRSAIPELLQASEHFQNVLAIQMTPDGSCRRIFRRTKGLWAPLEMYTRLCPTQRGWRELLVKSDDYDAYDVEWSLSPNGARTDVRLTVRSSVDLPVPSVMIRQGAIGGIQETFAELLRRLVGKR
jgi:hypothetical protein